MMPHSPEPWELTPFTDQMAIVAADGAMVAKVYGWRDGTFGQNDPATLKANANLLHASPTLLTACEAVKDWIENDTLADLDELSDDCKLVLENVRAAIKLAREGHP